MRRCIGLIAMAIAAMLAMASVVVPAQADTLPDAYTQIVNGQLPVGADGQPTFFGPNGGWGRYYTGPNGLEVRYTNGGTGLVLQSVFGIAVAAGTALTSGTASGVGALLLTGVKQDALQIAINVAGAGASPYIGDEISQLASRGLCLGVTIPPAALQGVFVRLDEVVKVTSGSAMSYLQAALSLAGSHDGDVKAWFEPCGSQPSAGLNDIVAQTYLPGVANVLPAQPITPAPPVETNRTDYNGDHKADLAVWRPSDGIWRVSNAGVPNTQWGWSQDIPAPADYDGDGKTDLATWRPSTGTWNVHFSSGRNDVMNYQWGWSEDIPVPADYDGDKKADVATWRPSTGVWNIHMSTGRPDVMNFQWGWSGDIPVPADYDGDGMTDVATFRPSTGQWNIHFSSGRNDVINYTFGSPGDIPVPADYDHDGKVDVGTYSPSTGMWNIHFSSGRNDVVNYQWGWAGDVPVPADYDGDGYPDIAVWRPSTGQWVVSMSHDAVWNPGPSWGWSTDIPAVSTLNRRILQGLGLRPAG